MARGRPRAFDFDEALESALCVFWEKGYEGASLTDLTEAMGINRPSLYASFGNKEQLFRKALDRYIERGRECFRELLDGPNVREAIEELLNNAANINTGGGKPRGCLLVQGALTCGEESNPIKEELAARRADVEHMLKARFKKARQEGELPADTDVSSLARFICAVMQGMSVQAASGASRKALQGVVAQAMRSWPV